MKVYDAKGNFLTIVSSLDEISDVEVPSPTDGYILYWDAATSKWKCKAVPVGAHNLGGAEHNADTLANLNAKVSDATLDKNTDKRDPNDHTHQAVGAGGKLDHGLALNGLTDDDHTQYLNTTRHDITARHTLGTVVPHDALASLTEKSHGSLTGVTASQHHTKYTDAEAVAAVNAAGLALASGKNIKLISALTGDHSWSGITAVMTAGTALVLPNACYVGSDSKMEKADADAAASMPVVALATGTIAENATGEFLLLGFFRDDTWNWTPGGLIYASCTAGELTQTAPAGTGDQVQVVGVALTADIILFNPSLELVEIS